MSRADVTLLVTDSSPFNSEPRAVTINGTDELPEIWRTKSPSGGEVVPISTTGSAEILAASAGSGAGGGAGMDADPDAEDDARVIGAQPALSKTTETSQIIVFFVLCPIC